MYYFLTFCDAGAVAKTAPYQTPQESPAIRIDSECPIQLALSISVVTRTYALTPSPFFPLYISSCVFEIIDPRGHCLTTPADILKCAPVLLHVEISQISHNSVIVSITWMQRDVVARGSNNPDDRMTV